MDLTHYFMKHESTSAAAGKRPGFFQRLILALDAAMKDKASRSESCCGGGGCCGKGKDETDNVDKKPGKCC